MSKPAMMSKAERRTAEAPQHVQIGSLRRQRERQCRQRRLAVQSGASQARPGQEMGDRFQGVRSILFARLEKAKRQADRETR